MLLSPSAKQSDTTRPTDDQIIEDLEERVFKDRLPESKQPPAPPQEGEAAA